jgi:ATP-dependent exoDNAse (exonuclease V) alpha subunit
VHLDRYLILSNAKKLGLTNGDRLTVDSVDSDGTPHSRRKNYPGRFQALVPRYVVTSHKSQGVTTANVIVAAAMLDQKDGLRHVF